MFRTIHQRSGPNSPDDDYGLCCILLHVHLLYRYMWRKRWRWWPELHDQSVCTSSESPFHPISMPSTHAMPAVPSHPRPRGWAIGTASHHPPVARGTPARSFYFFSALKHLLQLLFKPSCIAPPNALAHAEKASNIPHTTTTPRPLLFFSSSLVLLLLPAASHLSLFSPLPSAKVHCSPTSSSPATQLPLDQPSAAASAPPRQRRPAGPSLLATSLDLLPPTIHYHITA